MPREVQLDDEGFLDLRVGSMPTPVTVDIDATADDLTNMATASGDNVDEWRRALKEFWVGLGFPETLSHHVFGKMTTTVWDAAKALRKKDEPTPESGDLPGSDDTTDSTPTN